MRDHDIFAWPGLAPLAGNLPGALSYERGAWGKADGEPTDYRRLAQSAAFRSFPEDFERELLLGPEDRPKISTHWRSLERSFYAVLLYPSKARDAANRHGFAEKQILGWTGLQARDLPPALGAFFLLDAVAKLDDSLWYPPPEDSPWEDPTFVLNLPAQRHPPIEVTEERLREFVAQGIEQLRSSIHGESHLAALYTSILNRETAWLHRISEPLPPAALAALLLPLPPEDGRNLSLAGWIPSSRADPNLTSRWNVLVEPESAGLAPRSDVGPPSREGRRLAGALLDGDPSDLAPQVPVIAPPPSEPPPPPLPEDVAEEATPDLVEGVDSPSPAQDLPPAPAVGPEAQEPAPDAIAEADLQPPTLTFVPDPEVVPPTVAAQERKPTPPLTPRPGHMLEGLTPIPDDAPPIVKALYDFARSVDRRWFNAELFVTSHGRSRLDEVRPFRETLVNWVHEVGRWHPRYQSSCKGPIKAADPEQWKVKIDILRSAAVVLAPKPSTLKEIGSFESGGRIVPLFFYVLLLSTDRDQLIGHESENFRYLIRASRDEERKSSFAKDFNRWIDDWQKQAPPQIYLELQEATHPRSSTEQVDL